MPQQSIQYAIGRIRVLQKDALDGNRLERLINANSLEEAKRTLSEIGWSNADSLDYEQLSLEYVKKAAELIKAVTPEPEITDCFLLKYDIQNLKMLFKARCLKQKAEMISQCGTIKVDVLEHAVADHTYKKLPPMLREAMETLEKEAAIGIDPLKTDVLLDKAMYAMIFKNLKGKKAHSAKLYFTARVDMVNASMLLRAKRMGRNLEFFKDIYLDGGTIELTAWATAFEKPENIPTMLKAYGQEVTQAAQQAIVKPEELPALEKAMDNYLLSIFRPYKFEAEKIEVVLAYLLACEREAGAVRLIMAGKANGFANEAIRERLRDLYG